MAVEVAIKNILVTRMAIRTEVNAVEEGEEAVCLVTDKVCHNSLL